MSLGKAAAAGSSFLAAAALATQRFVLFTIQSYIFFRRNKRVTACLKNEVLGQNAILDHVLTFLAPVIQIFISYEIGMLTDI
jgi:hypothetical protein